MVQMEEAPASRAGCCRFDSCRGYVRFPEPSDVGETVHYVSWGSPVRPDGTQAYESECRAAMITQVSEETGFGRLVGLFVMNPTGLFFHSAVEQDQGKSPGSWHWRCASGRP